MMNIFDRIELCISSLPYNISSVKAWYDGTITFRMSEYLCDVTLDVIKSEIRLSLSIDEDSFRNRYINISDVGLIYLANVLNSNVDTVSFFAILEDGSQSLCLKKSFNYATHDEAIRFLIEGIISLKRIAGATLFVTGTFFSDEDTTDFYELITTEVNKSTFDSIVQTLPPLNILIVDDLFSTNLVLLKLQLSILLPKCRIYEAIKKLNSSAMMYSLENEIRKHDIDIVIAYGSGCFFAHQLKGVSKVLLNPNFFISEELQEHVVEINTDSSNLPYDIDTHRYLAVESCMDMADRQFKNLSFDDIDNTVGFFELGKCSGKNAETFNSVYGPTYTLSDNWLIGDEFIRFELIPTIERLYYKSHRHPFSVNTTRGKFAEHLRAAVNDHIAYARPAAYSECAYIKVSPFTHDITVDSGYREALLEAMGKDGQIIPDEDQIRFLTLQRYPDYRIKGFIDRIMNITEPYRFNHSHKLSEILLVVHRDGLSMEIKIKDKNYSITKNNTEDVYPLSRFFKRYKRPSSCSINLVRLTSVALKYISVEGLT